MVRVPVYFRRTSFCLLTVTIMVLYMPLVTALEELGDVSRDQSRAGADLPIWEEGDTWTYHIDDPDLETYIFLLMTIQDGATITKVTLCHYPSSRTMDLVYSLDAIQGDDYDVQVTETMDEPGIWKMWKYVTQPRCDTGDLVFQGTYVLEENNTGSMVIKTSDLNEGDKDIALDRVVSYEGDLYFKFTIDGTETSTVDHPCQFWKPGWETSPMDVTDSWTMDCTKDVYYAEHWVATGSLQGGFDEYGNFTYLYDMGFSVLSKASRTVMDNTYPGAYNVKGTGTVDWDWDDGQGNTANGQFNVLSNNWYADEGDYWDAGWGIEHDSLKLLVWSTHGPPIDWNDPPEVTKAPPAEITILEEEEWVFGDYTLSDTDPGACGSAGFKYSMTASYDGEVALPGLIIDADGILNLTPTQEDVADGYEITITVSDSCPGSAESVDMVFDLNIENVNDPPTVDTTIIKNFYLEEGNHTTSDWSLYDVFADEDLEMSELTGSPYDPDETLEYIIQSNGTLWVEIDEGTGRITFTAPDKRFPSDQNVTMTIMARDKEGAKASDTLMVRVLHMNHPPGRLDGEDRVVLEEDGSVRLDFEDYFTDPDVDDPGYLTEDSLYYFGWAKSNLSIEREGHLFTVRPWANWSGEEVVYIRASDTWGARVETEIEVEVVPVNDEPTVYFQTPDVTFHELDEPHDGLPGNDLLKAIVLSVTAHDIDDPDIFFNWTIRDIDSGEEYEWAIMSQEGMKTFRTDFIGEFMDGRFTGGQDTKDYLVMATVTDGKVTLDGGKWTIRVHDVNRPPVLTGMEVSLNKKGVLIPEAETDFRNYTLAYGKVYELNILDPLTDLDSDLEDLDCKWTMDGGQVLAIGACDEDGAINVSAGVKKGAARFKLGPGNHEITVTVSDEQDDTASVSYMFKVEDEPPSSWESFWAGMDMIFLIFAITLILTMFLVGMVLAYVVAKRRARRVPPPKPPGPVEPVAKVVAGPAPASKVKAVKRKVKKGKGKKKKVKKVVKRAKKVEKDGDEDIEIIVDEDVEEGEKGPSWMDDIPDDFK